ncbi:hypothetical protein Taro_000214 [Colocasia esculenta]|uniref:Uncharacterized protein n=1 Tax=Colocasia esculenta TaxID=4460 RepID=A0A843TBI7_COLES|nr:hypothetical protein [Colocasia esculenta]
MCQRERERGGGALGEREDEALREDPGAWPRTPITNSDTGTTGTTRTTGGGGVVLLVLPPLQVAVPLPLAVPVLADLVWSEFR